MVKTESKCLSAGEEAVKVSMEELAANVARRIEFNFPKEVARKVIAELFAEISDQVSDGRPVNIQGFGQFSAYLRNKKKTGLKNQKGELPERRVPKFKPGNTFLRKVSRGR